MKLSIIIGVYNQEELIIRALDSIPRRNDIEVLICDDASTDNTLENIKKYQKDHKELNIRIMNNPVNKGFGVTKNILYDNALGEYISQLDSDDYLYTETFNKIIDLIDDEDIIYQDLKVNDGSIFHITNENKSGYCGGSFRIIKKSFLGKNRCPEIRAGEDWYLTQELNKLNPKEKYTNLVGYHYNFPRQGSLFDLMIKGEL